MSSVFLSQRNLEYLASVLGPNVITHARSWKRALNADSRLTTLADLNREFISLYTPQDDADYNTWADDRLNDQLGFMKDQKIKRRDAFSNTIKSFNPNAVHRVHRHGLDVQETNYDDRVSPSQTREIMNTITRHYDVPTYNQLHATRLSQQVAERINGKWLI